MKNLDHVFDFELPDVIPTTDDSPPWRAPLAGGSAPDLRLPEATPSDIASLAGATPSHIGLAEGSMPHDAVPRLVDLGEGSWRVHLDVAGYAHLDPRGSSIVDPAFDVAYIIDRPVQPDATPLDARVLAGALASWKHLRRSS